MWQKPKYSTLHFTDQVWYEGRMVGKDMLERYMKLSLAKSVKLDGDYTNHSIRATVISTLDNTGFEARHIISLSSHKNESTIKEYATKCPENKKREMFDSLTNALQPKAKKIKPSASASIATPNKQNNDVDIMDVKENLPTFEIQPIDQFDTIDDSVLSEILLDADKLLPQYNNTVAVNQNSNNNALTSPPQANIQTQVNTINNHSHPQVPFNFQRIPQLYFPNSTVTINYSNEPSGNKPN